MFLIASVEGGKNNKEDTISEHHSFLTEIKLSAISLPDPSDLSSYMERVVDISQQNNNNNAQVEEKR